MIYIIGILLLCLFMFLWRNKVKIKFKTFTEPGFSPTIGKYGIYCYCAKQGGGKTLSCIGYLYDNRDKKIYANLKSINSSVIPYTYINGLDELLKLRGETDCIIFFDEIFTEISKLVKTDAKKAKDIMDFLSQMRKRKIILLTTCQEWRLLPLYFRLYVRFQVNCRTYKIPLIKGIVIKNFIDGDNIKWDELEQDFVGELIENTVEHTRKNIADLYDTYEQIGEFSNCSNQPAESTELRNRLDLIDLKKDELTKKIDEEFWETSKLEDLEEPTPLFKLPRSGRTQ